MAHLSRRALGGMLLAALIWPVPGALAHDDKESIVELLMGMFSTPENPLTVAPVIVSGDHAIAGWVQGERGGRALLRRNGHHWAVHLCSGDGLKQAAFLEQTGIPATQAAEMTAALAAAEAALDPTVLAKFASFEGTVMIEPGAQHGHKP